VDIERTYSAQTILRFYGGERSKAQVPEEAFRLLAAFRAQPFVLRVREGAEQETANVLRQNTRVAAAIPNFVVRSLSEFIISEQAIDSLKVHSGPAPTKKSRIAIIDTGVEPTRLSGTLNLSPVQYDVEAPRADLPPHDSAGHGTAVARIIEQIAPYSSVLSVKALPNGTLAGVVMAIQIALSTFKPHVVNLSLGIDDVSEYCPNCGYPSGQQFPESQLHRFFEALDNNPMIEPPAYVAAAGNRNAITLPARCSTTIAVGSFDRQKENRSDYAEYPQVPADRFIMAEGGSEYTSFGQSWKGEQLYGTSFSAAIISAVAAGFGATHNCPLTMRECILRRLPTMADRDIPDYNPALHGLGVVRTS
jgi:hypothetical protein